VSWTTGVAIYFVLWWLVLFAVLPWGVQSQADQGEVVPGSDPGAPAVPMVLVKLLWTTAIAGVVFFMIAASYSYRLVTLDDMSRWLGLPFSGEGQ
jgi:predicted secreted protein